MTVRAIIVDDEELARERIADLLTGDPQIEVVAQAAGGHEAVEMILEHRPDLVFLDVQMPELDGFGVIQSLEPDEIPAVIFITAYDAYAVKAFEVHALDYLLKPFDRERFSTALTRAKERLGGPTPEASGLGIQGLLAAVQTAEEAYISRLSVRSRGKSYFVQLTDVEWIEATGNYVTLHTGVRTHMVRGTMRRLEQLLDPEQFVRVHRSTMVGVSHIALIAHAQSGDFAVTLRNGDEVSTGETYRHVINTLLKNPL